MIDVESDYVVVVNARGTAVQLNDKHCTLLRYPKNKALLATQIAEQLTVDPATKGGPFKVIKDKDYLRIQNLRQQVEFEEDDYLRQRGWQHVCNVPGSFWVWTREYKGAPIMAPRALALEIQANIDYLHSAAVADEGEA